MPKYIYDFIFLKELTTFPSRIPWFWESRPVLVYEEQIQKSPCIVNLNMSYNVGSNTLHGSRRFLKTKQIKSMVFVNSTELNE